MEDDRGRLRHVDVSDRPLDEPLLDGTATLLEGRAPEGPGEVVLNEVALAGADAEVGDEVELFLLGAVEVVGEFRGEATAGPQAVAVDGPAPHRDTDVRVFVDVPAGEPATPDVAALMAVGASSEIVDGRGEPFRWVADEVRSKVSTTYAVVGVVLVVTAIVASAAFAVGARRQVRTLGVLSASGAPPAVLRRAVLLQGTVTGVVASLIGAALGLVGAAIAIPLSRTQWTAHCRRSVSIRLIYPGIAQSLRGRDRRSNRRSLRPPATRRRPDRRRRTGRPRRGSRRAA
jgi:putative ABC transport system permease protein